MTRRFALPHQPAVTDAEALRRELRALFRERGIDRLPTEEVVEALVERLGRPITATRLARTLGPHGVGPSPHFSPGPGLLALAAGGGAFWAWWRAGRWIGRAEAVRRRRRVPGGVVGAYGGWRCLVRQTAAAINRA
jgi:hypothetical protein